MGANLRRPLLFAALGALSITALVAIGALLTQEFGDTQLRILATTGGFGLSSLIAMRGTAVLDRNRHIALGRVVVSLSGLSFVFELWILWLDNDSELAWKSYVCCISTAVALAQIAGMLGRRQAADPVWIPRLIRAAGISALLAAAMTWAAAIGEIDHAGYYRFFGAVVVLDVFLVALQPVLRRLGKPEKQGKEPPQHFVLVATDGSRIHGAARDLPQALADGLREAEQRGRRITRIEIGDG